MHTIANDFDGAITDLDRESATYEESYLELFSRRFSLPLHELTEVTHISQKTILASPGKYGWMDSGLIVVEASADPYLFTQTAARMALEAMSLTHPTIPATDWNQVFYELWVESYAKTGTFFRPWAKEYLTLLAQKSNFTIVTNSKTEPVIKKLNLLLGNQHGIRVEGNAQKLKLDLSWTGVPAQITPPVFPRPIQLRRKFYFDILERIGPVDRGCGDIYELDLSLLDYFSIRTVLMLTGRTPTWDRAHYTAQPNRLATDSLETAADFLLS